MDEGGRVQKQAEKASHHRKLLAPVKGKGQRRIEEEAQDARGSGEVSASPNSGGDCPQASALGRTGPSLVPATLSMAWGGA